MLDIKTEPGRLIGRGVEDDKGPIACAIHAMAALAERKIPLARRIELIISYTEESDWEPFRQFLEEVPPPQLNIAIDAEYPVTIGEKAWASLHLLVHPQKVDTGDQPFLKQFGGGAFLSQVPEHAIALIANPTPAIEALLKQRATRHPAVQYHFKSTPEGLEIKARGKSAHSSQNQTRALMPSPTWLFCLPVIPGHPIARPWRFSSSTIWLVPVTGPDNLARLPGSIRSWDP